MNIDCLSTIGLFFMVCTCLGLVAWLYRPNSGKLYEEYSKIPFDDKFD